jgi:signal transduction histidine kinase
VSREVHDGDLGTELLPDETETALYRVAQEALTNARKHAKTTSAHVGLGRRGTKVRLEVRDFGRGFEHSATPEGSGLGEKVSISGMRERITLLSGDFKARSRPGQGTTVVAEVPLPPAEGIDAGRGVRDSAVPDALADDHISVREGTRTTLEGRLLRQL